MSSTRATSYGSLAADLRGAILGGEYGDEDRLPTEAELAAGRGISRQTVRRAMQELVNEGLVYRVAGRGTYPVGRSDRYLRHLGSVEDLMSLSLDTDCEIIRPLRRRVDVAAAGRLRLSVDTVHSVSFVRRHDAVPFCHTDVALPSEVGQQLEGIAELTTPGAVSRVTVIGLVDALPGRPIRDAEQSVTATTLPAELAERLVPPRGPRSCGSTGCTSIRATVRSSSRSVTSTRTTTRTACGCVVIRCDRGLHLGPTLCGHLTGAHRASRRWARRLTADRVVDITPGVRQGPHHG